jgi:predicted nuclease with TOPRIM domain
MAKEDDRASLARRTSRDDALDMELREMRREIAAGFAETRQAITGLVRAVASLESSVSGLRDSVSDLRASVAGLEATMPSKSSVAAFEALASRIAVVEAKIPDKMFLASLIVPSVVAIVVAILFA